MSDRLVEAGKALNVQEGELPSESRRASKARFAVATLFFVFGLLIGTWAPHIPLANEKLHAAPFWFGLSLLCMGLGAMFTMPLIGIVIARHGSARVSVVTALLSIAAILPPFIAPTLPVFAATLLFFGGALGALDVSMNAHGVLVEQKLHRPTMSSFHGVYSVAGLFGGLLSSILIQRINEFERASLTCVVCCLMLFFARRHLLPADEDRGKTTPTLSLPSRSTIGLGLLCLLTFMIEAATIDWTGIYLREQFSVAGTAIGLNFAAYSTAMAIARFTGDKLRETFGVIRLVTWLATACAIFMVAGLLAPVPQLSIALFALSGFALGPIAPILVIEGGRADRANPSRGISAVTTLGYAGNTLGPPVVGFMAGAAGLDIALAVVGGLAFLIAGFFGASSRAVTRYQPP